MRIGISVCSNYAVRDVRVGARNMIERARAARDAGLDSLFVGDHHVTAVPYYQNSVILGRMLAEWGDGPAGALYLLPLWNPVLVAEQAATLACIAKGRFILQCGLGDRRQAKAMGVAIGHRGEALEESLSIMRSLWRGERVSSDGHYRIVDARIAPLPPEEIDVWIGASAPPAIDRAARLGDAWLADPGMDFTRCRERIAIYREACARHGRMPTTIAIRRDIYVGASASEARKTMAPYIDKGYRGMPEEALVIGDVSEVADRFAALAELGYTDVIVRNIATDQSQAVATIERLARVRERLAA